MPSATLTDAGRNLVRDARLGLATDIAIKYVAVGTGTTAPTASDTQLEAEVFRKALTTSSSPGTGQSKVTVYLSPSDVAGTTIQEVGWFAGPSATSAANSGVLVARALYTLAKSNTESWQDDFTLTE